MGVSARKNDIYYFESIISNVESNINDIINTYNSVLKDTKEVIDGIGNFLKEKGREIDQCYEDARFVYDQNKDLYDDNQREISRLKDRLQSADSESSVKSILSEINSLARENQKISQKISNLAQIMTELGQKKTELNERIRKLNDLCGRFNDCGVDLNKHYNTIMQTINIVKKRQRHALDSFNELMHALNHLPDVNINSETLLTINNSKYLYQASTDFKKTMHGIDQDNNEIINDAKGYGSVIQDEVSRNAIRNIQDSIVAIEEINAIFKECCDQLRLAGIALEDYEGV